MNKEQFKKALGQRIHDIRTEKGMTLEQLASSIDKKYHSILRVEKGNINCTLFYIIQIAEGLGVDVAELVKKLPE